MKVPLLFSAILANLVALLSLCSTTVFAEQGYAIFQMQASESHVAVGKEISIAVYIVGKPNAEFKDTQYGKVTLSMESWQSGDVNPRGFEFVRFDSSGSDFSIDGGVSVTAGANNNLCRNVEREASADMTGRRYFGSYVFRSLNPGTYSFGPRFSCQSIIESLTGGWGIIWNDDSAYVTVDQPTQSTPVQSGSTGSQPSTPVRDGSTTANAKEDNAPSVSVEGAQETTAQAAQNTKLASAATSDSYLRKKNTGTNRPFMSLLFVAILALAFAIWKVIVIRKRPKIEKPSPPEPIKKLVRKV